MLREGKGLSVSFRDDPVQNAQLGLHKSVVEDLAEKSPADPVAFPRDVNLGRAFIPVVQPHNTDQSPVADATDAPQVRRCLPL